MSTPPKRVPPSDRVLRNTPQRIERARRDLFQTAAEDLAGELGNIDITTSSSDSDIADPTTAEPAMQAEQERDEEAPDRKDPLDFDSAKLAENVKAWSVDASNANQ